MRESGNFLAASGIVLLARLIIGDIGVHCRNYKKKKKKKGKRRVSLDFLLVVAGLPFFVFYALLFFPHFKKLVVDIALRLPLCIAEMFVLICMFIFTCGYFIKENRVSAAELYLTYIVFQILLVVMIDILQ